MLHRTLALLTILIFVLTACSDSDTGPKPAPEHVGTLSGYATDLGTGQPLAGTTVILMTEEFAIRQVQNTGDDGSFFFEGLTTEPLLLYGLKEHYRMAEASSSQFNMPPGQPWAASLPMMDDPVMEYDYHINGRVTNVATGHPVPGAWIASISLAEAGNSLRYLVENSGINIAVSDEEGYYSLLTYGVPEYFGGPVIGLSPVSVGCVGFMSRTFAGDGPNFAFEPYLPGGLLPAPADSTLILDISLAPIPEGGLPADAIGSVRGTIVHNNQPQSGVLVSMTLMALADRDTVFDPDAKVLFNDSSVLSAADGSFEFNVQPGFYAIRAGLLPDDGWCRSNGPIEFEVASEAITDVGNVSIGAAIAPISPTPGSEVVGAWPKLSWTPIEGAEFYIIQAGFDSFYYNDFGSTTETEWDWSPELPLPEETTLIRWKIYAAYRDEEMNVVQFSWFEVPASFTMKVDGSS